MQGSILSVLFTNPHRVLPILFFSLKPLLKPLTVRLSSTSQTMPPSSSKMVAEYAKSNKSTCKGCNKSIAKKELRLGVTTSDPRGFENTKWHHMGCFSFESNSAESIKGFDSLEGVDQETLKKHFEDVDMKTQTKLSVTSEANVEVAPFNLQPQTMPSSSSNMVAEYAKSNRSTCKRCNKSIAEKELRLGLTTNDPRGTKWYHMGCLSFESNSAESIKGFDSLEDVDQEALKKLFEDVNRKAQTKVKGKSEDVESKTPKNPTKKQKLSITSEVNVEVALSASDIMDKYKDATLLPKWKAFQTLIFLEKDDDLLGCSKIAAFDFDGCLVKTSVKRIGADAWSLMYPSVPEKLQKLYKDGYKLVIFTNESNIDRWKNKRQVAVDSKIGRLNNFIKLVNVPIQVFIACGFDKSGVADPFRKPKPGMWQIMETNFNSGIKIDMDQSFYVGDAAGRQSDHSDADIKFAEAVGLKFYVPEEYFDV